MAKKIQRTLVPKKSIRERVKLGKNIIAKDALELIAAKAEAKAQKIVEGKGKMSKVNFRKAQKKEALDIANNLVDCSQEMAAHRKGKKITVNDVKLCPF